MSDLRKELFDFFDKETAAVIAAENGKVIYANPAAGRVVPDILGADAAEVFGGELSADGTAAEGFWRGMHARGADLGPLRLITVSDDVLPLWEERSFVDALVSEIRESLGSGLYRLFDMTRRVRDAGDLASIRDLAAMDRSICRVLRVARNLGRLYGGEDSQPRRTLLDLGDVVGDIVSTVSYFSRGRNVKLEFRRESPVELYADRRLVEIMVMELLSNAVKFSREGGTVTVTAGVSGGSAVITVTDRGGEGGARLLETSKRFGVPASALDPDTGAGLGLRVVRRLAALHGGAVIIQTLPENSGTVVTVALPLTGPEDGTLSEFEETGCSAFDILIEIADITDNSAYESRDVI